MTNKEQIVEISWKVDSLLSQYVVIHDAVFKTSIRHIIPIPGIFKAIDFAAHLAKAETIVLKLENCEHKINALAQNASQLEKEYLNLFSQYMRVLIETVNHLKVVLGALYAKSQSFIDSTYDWKNYKSDLAKYEQSVQEYVAIGRRLNELFQKIG